MGEELSPRPGRRGRGVAATAASGDNGAGDNGAGDTGSGDGAAGDRATGEAASVGEGSGRGQITSIEGIPALSLDAISSVAYGPEAMLVVLATAGAGALGKIEPITVAIVVLLVILVFSYRQVIAAFPDGGGCYAVSKANLGAGASRLGAASLVVDYVLTVAVSISAGVAALVSAFPTLGPDSLPISLAFLAVLTALNLRGIATSARTFLLPTAVFIAGIYVVIVAGLLRSHPAANAGIHPAIVPKAAAAVGVLLLLKAFAAGCSALTGVEAIANDVPAFRAPSARRAMRTEVLLGGILGTMLLGLAFLTVRFHVAPEASQTVLSQITGASVGRGAIYYVVDLATTVILALAANTSFGGLPVLASLLARDNLVPHVFGLRADRPVYRYGVIVLAVLAGVLLIAVNANTNSLIPLYAIGVFTGFTLSQTGLVRHWHTLRPPRWLGRAALNGIGAVMTAVATVIFLVTKFTGGGLGGRDRHPCAHRVVYQDLPLLRRRRSRARPRRHARDAPSPRRPDSGDGRHRVAHVRGGARYRTVVWS